MNKLNTQRIFIFNKQLCIALLLTGVFSCVVPNSQKIEVLKEAVEFAPSVKKSHDNIYQQVIIKHSKKYDKITMERYNKGAYFRVLGYTDDKSEEIDVGNHENRKYLFQKLHWFYYYSDSLMTYTPSAKNSLRYETYYYYKYFFNTADAPSDCISCDSLKANFDREAENLDCMLDEHWMIRMDFDPSN